MENLNLVQNLSTLNLMQSGRPTIPSGKQPVVEKKINDPSSTCPKGEGYPIPAFFEYRFKGRDFDPL